MTEKYIQGGKFAILYSPGYGAGWSTWGDDEMAFDKDLVEAFLNGGKESLRAITKKKYPNSCLLGIEDIQITWINVGTSYRIKVFDGSESIKYI